MAIESGMSDDVLAKSCTPNSAVYHKTEPVTVFTTVGFGDITPKTEAARLVVTGQMIADLLILGIAIKVIVGAVQQRRQPPDQASSPPPSQ